MMNTPLYTRQNEVTPLASRAGKIDALYFNHVQSALKHLEPHIRLRIPTLKHLDLILQKDAWIIVDRALYDYPILCWTEFETEGRDNLHEPIKCEIRYFHFAATMVHNKTLEAMELMLGELMEQYLPDEDDDDKSNVIPLKKD